MTPQQHASQLLALWQSGRAAGIPPEHRLPPINDNRTPDDFERDLDVIRRCMERV